MPRTSLETIFRRHVAMTVRRPAPAPALRVPPAFLEQMRRGPSPALLYLELPRPVDLQVDDQIELPTEDRRR